MAAKKTEYILKQLEKSVFGFVGFASEFLFSLAPCLRQWSLAPNKNSEAPSLPNSRFFKLFQYNGKSVLVIGLGISGRSAVRFLLERDAKVTGVDQNETLFETHPELIKLRSDGLTALRQDHPIDLDKFDYVVVSPGIPQTHPLYAQAVAKKKELIGEVELACRELQSGTFLGITGTNGKTTVTLLVNHVLNFCGKPALALGNVGTPLTSEMPVDIQDKIIVAELSSYQLETLHSKVLDAAVVLNITPDHLDRYATMEEYAAAKMTIKNNLKPNGVLFIEEKAFQDFGYLLYRNNLKNREFGKEGASEFLFGASDHCRRQGASENKNSEANPTKPKTDSSSCFGINGFSVELYGYSESCTIYSDTFTVFEKGKKTFSVPEEFQGRKNHEIENMMAAYAMCRSVGVSPQQFVEAFNTFKKPAHRIEFVKKMRGVSYYDDSKGTNIDAVIRAVSSLNGKIVLIAGGVDKGSSYTPWIAAFADQVKCICTIGQAAKN